jgi:hypothetical protein
VSLYVKLARMRGADLSGYGTAARGQDDRQGDHVHELCNHEDVSPIMNE